MRRLGTSNESTKCNSMLIPPTVKAKRGRLEELHNGTDGIFMRVW